MHKRRAWVAATLTISVLSILAATACRTVETTTTSTGTTSSGELDPNHAQLVMTSEFCAGCHPAIYAEHEQNTHGRAFTDEEVRIATGRFDHGDCIRCHTPRPIFETGIGQNPMRRYHGLEEGNTCMTCHWKQGHDYSRFAGGAECNVAFDDRVGEVEACASCHRNHGTPYQWEIAPTGKAAGNTCMTCHMRTVYRPVAVGEPPRRVRSHTFPGARSESQLRRAYEYEAEIEADEVVVRITNSGAGHHFPTELKQRAVESLVVVRDEDGNEVSRSRMVFRDPYKRPYGLKLPVNTQIPPGQTREHRVPIKVPAGVADCELHFKLYFPIEDHHPELARQLEDVRLPFSGVTPSDAEVVSEPGAVSATAEGIDPKLAGVANLVDFMRPEIDDVEIPIPEGSGPDDIRELIELFQFPVPEGNRIAQARLVEIGLPAVPALIEALGSWDNKTFHQAASVLQRIGAPAVPALLDALTADELYVRYHAREIIAASDPGGLREGDGGDEETRARVVAAARAACAMESALDRRSALELAGALRLHELRGEASRALGDDDPDVVVAAARCLVENLVRGIAEADIARVETAMRATFWDETRRELALALCELGSAAGVPVLLAGLDHRDDLIREDFFESLFAVTGEWRGYDPFAPRPERLAAIARLQAWWARDGGFGALRHVPKVPAAVDDAAWSLVSKLADGRHDDAETLDALVDLGTDAVPALVRGLKLPSGFADRRARICEALSRIGSTDAAPALAATLRDPVVGVAAWACWALLSCGDDAAAPALRGWRDRLLTLHAQGRVPAALDFDVLLAQAEQALVRFE